MGRTIGVALALLMVALGVLWTLQGYGVLGGSPMTGQRTWTLVGPALAGLGVALGIVALGGGKGRR